MNNQCSFSNKSKKLFQSVEKFVSDGKQYLSTSLINQAMAAVDKVNKAIRVEEQRRAAEYFAKKEAEERAREDAYWATQPAGERERLDKEIQETENSIRRLKPKLETTAYSDQMSRLEYDIREAGFAINRASGIFAAKRRRELQEYKSGLEKELSEVRKKHYDECQRVQRIIDDLNDKLYSLKQKRRGNM